MNLVHMVVLITITVAYPLILTKTLPEGKGENACGIS